MHYCMGKLADWGLGLTNSKTCDKCGMKNSHANDNGCCKDENKFVKNESDQRITEAGLPAVKLLVIEIPLSFNEITSGDIHTLFTENPVDKPPLLSSSVAVYIRNCVFLI